ncbi:MAG: DUF5110 domain-containing protein [Ruminococcaceae bacterium]|nr:DUF5110 domain-containing protein [Oscillospiraceae bacterium]
MNKFLPNPVADKKAIVRGKDFRFTVLTSQLIRLEYAKDGKFEDRKTQSVVNRLFPVPDYKTIKKDGTIKIETDSIRLTYRGGEFSKNTLSISFCGRLGKYPGVWYFGDEPKALPGTNRTLDGVSGGDNMPKSIMSQSSFGIMDDSHTLAQTLDGWVEVRDEQKIDMYVFAYPKEYKECLNAYYTLTGKTPLLPRFAMGNWWSRYHKYSDTEYINLMEKFKKENIPLSVAVIDMDWHKVNIDTKYGSGWTGFSWDKNLFKDPKDFLKYLHDNNMKATLNLHPAEGISAHEDCYEETAKAMGVDYKNEENVAFDIADKKFVDVYFDKVLKPLEDDGVDFWWMDWQQGNTTKTKGLDPLWMLNHFHYHDNTKNNSRGLLFSRFSGFGSHRYPVGFSGDTIINWESLDFQPYFTLCASNVGYGWWSHDIGGHMRGYRDDELMNRWTQLGTFSPILRLHCSNNEFINREPWHFNYETYKSMKKFLRLRYEMIPYTYTMNFRAHNDNMPIITPMYYEYPDISDAYEVKNEYFFGTEMIVCPITQKKDEVTQMASVTMYLPKGKWFDFFNKYMYEGNRKVKVYRKYDEMPVLAKAGAIIPTCEIKDNSVENPKEVILNIFPGANNEFTLYEDDGKSLDYENGKCVKTKIYFDWDNKTLKISKPQGDLKLIPKDRSYKIILNCVNNVRASSNVNVQKSYKNGAIEIKVKADDEIIISFSKTLKISENDYVSKVYDILNEAHSYYDAKIKIYNIVKEKSKKEAICDICAMDIDNNLKNALLEVII